ncbi:MAG: NUDIX hydrolase [Anaerolineales bacterium]|nr:NUDIX hydrolase [Anaerolineales bacterium]
MASLRKYFKLMKDHPHLFENPKEEGVIQIITNPNKIKSLQAKKKLEYKKSGKKPEWIDIGVLSEDPWFWVLRDLVKFPDGKIGGYLRILNRKSLEGGTNVVMFPTLDGKVVLLKRFSHDNRDWIWEIPHGFGEPGLSAEDCARKELEEETGLIAKSLIEIGRMEGADGATAFYYAEMLNGELKPEIGEAISKCELLSLPEFEQWLFSGKITNWFATISYLMCKSKGIFK